jgi:tetratricopeptide (TPR) repeat protein
MNMKNLSYMLLFLMLAICFSTAPVAQDKPEGNSKNDSAKAVLEYVRVGSAFFLKRDYKNAIKPYEKALDLEKKQSTLEKTIWRVLVDNLGMAYGITGDLKKAKRTFEYGLSKDPDYPMFHYNMACTYAEMDDKDQAIAYLKSAFKNKKNMIAGEQMPSPANDSSFARFMKDEKFINALKEIEQ